MPFYYTSKNGSELWKRIKFSIEKKNLKPRSFYVAYNNKLSHYFQYKNLYAVTDIQNSLEMFSTKTLLHADPLLRKRGLGGKANNVGRPTVYWTCPRSRRVEERLCPNVYYLHQNKKTYISLTPLRNNLYIHIRNQIECCPCVCNAA
jgi:hypothetical protein